MSWDAVRSVVVDFPWMERGGGRVKRGADRHYNLVKTSDGPDLIRSCEHWERLALNAHGYFWVTNNHLPDGLWLMAELGFRYVTNLVWTKDRIGLGQYFRGQHELVLFGVRGKPGYTEGTHSTWLGQRALKRTRHSQKPPELLDLVEAASPGAWLELFARDPRPGWLSWGDEI